jgi:hypothetical protein
MAHRNEEGAQMSQKSLNPKTISERLLLVGRDDALLCTSKWRRLCC